MSNFKIIAKKGLMRAGELQTAHGVVKTPVYMPVGTQGTVKALSPDDLQQAGAQIILGNTYHLNLRPGSKLIEMMGGLQKWSGWGGPILTDSGGFQAFSLGAMIEHGVRKVPRKNETNNEQEGEGSAKINYKQSFPTNKIVTVKSSYNFPNEDNCENGREKNVEKGRVKPLLSVIQPDGVLFKSHLDGSQHLLTPERSAGIQLELGSDIVLVLDELLSPLHSPTYVRNSLQRTHEWELRSKNFFEKNLASSTNPKAQLYGILQGVYDREIRESEAKWIAEQGFDGVSIGGSFGFSEYWGQQETDWAATKAIYETIGWVSPLLPEDLPRHILGIGEVVDFFECIERGADMFDCVSPTRRARNGSLYISPKDSGNEPRKSASFSGPFGTPQNKFTLSLQRAEFAKDPSPIDPGCKCYTCQNFSKSYLRHLFVARELLYFRLASIHNVYFVLHLVDQIRESIIDGQFEKLKQKWLG